MSSQYGREGREGGGGDTSERQQPPGAQRRRREVVARGGERRDGRPAPLARVEPVRGEGHGVFD